MPEITGDRRRFVQYHFVEFFVAHLLDISRAFGGDLQEMLILAIVGQVHMRAGELGRENAAISASRIADVSAIPRQTVRRKLQSLKLRGWVEQVENGAWRLVVREREPSAQQGLRELDQRSLERVIKLVRALHPHIHEDADP